MHTVWEDLRAGARDARWSLYFLIVLLPATLVVGLFAYALEGRISSPPSPLTWALMVPAVLISLFVAGLLDKPDGRLGSKVWLLVLLAVTSWLIRRAIREPGGTHQATVNVFGAGFIVTLEATPVEVRREIGRGFPDVRVRWNPLDGTSGRGIATVH